MPGKATHEEPPVNPSARIEALRLEDDGTYPNNGALPALHYRRAFALPPREPARVIERCFHANGWSNGWRDGVYDCHHYHSAAHEVLGCYAGTARVQLGGPQGSELYVSAGDVVVIPAGVAHKRLSASDDFRVVGCYAGGRDYDMNYGKASERPQADENIDRVPAPDSDPVYGKSGPLMQHWVRAR
ncbi:MAG TPA: hypothetical protein VK524_07005 [Polyangiaceae bacterium]|nr:hypothetical protein [Polyangiaceae bacterium]